MNLKKTSLYLRYVFPAALLFTATAGMAGTNAEKDSLRKHETKREDVNRPNAIKLDIVSHSGGVYGLAGEVALGGCFSLQMGAYYVSPYGITEGSANYYPVIPVRGIKISPELRVYPWNKKGGVTRGYFGILANYYHLVSDLYPIRFLSYGPPISSFILMQRGQGADLRAGALMGYQFKWKSGFTFDINWGVHTLLMRTQRYRVNNTPIPGWRVVDELRGRGPGMQLEPYTARMCLGIGYSF